MNEKTALSAYGNVRSVGLNAINILEGDELIDVQITSGDDEVILATREGMAIRFHESDVREMGRTATGVYVKTVYCPSHENMHTWKTQKTKQRTLKYGTLSTFATLALVGANSPPPPSPSESGSISSG